MNSHSKRNLIFLIIAFLLVSVFVYFYKIEPRYRDSNKNIERISMSTLTSDSRYQKRCPALDQNRVLKYLKLSLECIDREYPNKPNYVFESEEDMTPIRENTPAFFGCYDWHSAVHGHWSMVRILNKFPEIAEKSRITDALSRHLSAKNIEAELNFFLKERNNLFERPYGWGWLLRLATELKGSEIPEMRSLYKNVDPLARFISDKFIKYIKQLSRPIREGTHQNTAFSMIHLYDYLTITENVDARNEVMNRAIQFFYQDRDCPINYEPSGEDFISPCLTEADLMRRILIKEQFLKWFDGLLKPEKLRESLLPIEVNDPQDPRIGHLIGLFYQRASSLYGVLSVLDPDDYRRAFFEEMIDRNCLAAEQYLDKSGYGGEHWLASFAIFYYTNATLK